MRTPAELELDLELVISSDKPKEEISIPEDLVKGYQDLNNKLDEIMEKIQNKRTKQNKRGKIANKNGS